MNTYQLVRRTTISTNTPEHGFGDYPETIWKEWATVEADDEKRAKAEFKKKYKGLKFSGRFPPFCVWIKK